MFVTRAESDLGLRLPLSSMLTKPTIAELAESLEAGAGQAHAHSPAPGPLVELNAGGERPPLFLVAGVGGQAFVFRELAKSLGPDQPVYAFTTGGAADQQLSPQSVEELATTCEQEIEKRGVPKAPLIFAGYSFGGLVAFELARRFRARGHEVGRIIAFDAFAPGFPERMPFLERARAHVRVLRRSSTRGRARYALEHVIDLGRGLLRRLGLQRWLAPPTAGSDREHEERSKRVWVLAQRAQAGYRPGTADEGPLLLFASETPTRLPGTRLADAALGWGKWIRGRVDVVPVKGGHLDVFRSDNVERMASEIRNSIDAVAQRHARRVPRAGALVGTLAS
jgi:thioesterase domain-containing protein